MVTRTKMETLRTLDALEKRVFLQSQRKRIETAILGTTATLGLIGVAVLAPNALQLLRHVIPLGNAASQKQSVKRAIHRLISRGFLARQGDRYRLTKKGSERLSYLLSTAQAKRALHVCDQRWDGKWRIVTFDVKESRKHVRDELRRILMDAGFVKLQESVWIFPYRCEETIALLKFHLTLGRDLIYIVADVVEGDEWLRDCFSLPKHI